MILAMNPGMRSIGWSGDFYGLRIFTVSNWLMKLINADMQSKPILVKMKLLKFRCRGNLLQKLNLFESARLKIIV